MTSPSNVQPDSDIVSAPAMTSAFIACPLRYEASLIRRALQDSLAQVNRPEGYRFDVQCCGLGSGGVVNWASKRGIPRGAPVVLAGTCGSLRDEILAGTALVIGEVRDGDGGSWTPAVRSESDGAVIVSANAIITGIDDRRDLGRRTGAHVVDWEAVAFARIATERGWNWGVVRGVSDDFHTSVPANMENWLTSAGGMRIFPILARILRKPGTLRELRCLHHNSTNALRNAATLIKEILNVNRNKSSET